MPSINNSNNQVSLKPDQPNPHPSITDRLVQAFGRVWQTIKTASHKLYAMVFRVNEVGTDVLSNKNPSLSKQNSKKEETSVLSSEVEPSPLNEVETNVPFNEVILSPTFSEIKPSLNKENSEVTPGGDFDFDVNKWEYFYLINVEAQGDCQILAFIEGLAEKHSSLLQKANGTKYSPEEIRKLEIDFIRKKINGEEAPNYKGEVTQNNNNNNNTQENYSIAIQAGFFEHNEAAEAELPAANPEDSKASNEIANQKQELQANKYTYEFLLVDKDTPELAIAECKIKLAEINEELKKLEDFEKPVFDRLLLKSFNNIDEYLDYLSQSKSYCSNANLMALSELFKVPIYLHVRGNEDQPVQKFNLSQSDLDPIHLHFSTEEKHYQLRSYIDQD